MKNNIIKKYEDLNKECKKYPRINLGSLYQGYSMKIKPLEEGYAKVGLMRDVKQLLQLREKIILHY